VSGQRPTFASTVCRVYAQPGEGIVDVLVADMGFDSDLYLDADEARSFAAALLAAADASEATT